MEMCCKMETKAMINSIYLQLEDLSSIVKEGIENLNKCNNEHEKAKIQKCLVDNLHKITSTILLIKKLEKAQEQDGTEKDGNDEIILAEYVKRFKSMD